jgi:hypothetical protein
MRLVFSCCAALVVSGCISSGSPMGVTFKSRTQFEVEWSAYLEMAPHKAMAIAGDIDSQYVLGYSHAYPTEASAIDEALEACEERRTDRRMEAPCKLYASSDELRDASEAR